MQLAVSETVKMENYFALNFFKFGVVVIVLKIHATELAKYEVSYNRAV